MPIKGLDALLFVDEDDLFRVADPEFVAACQQHTISRYYTCDIDVANDPDVTNNRTWLTCPTYIGTSFLPAEMGKIEDLVILYSLAVQLRRPVQEWCKRHVYQN